METTTRKQLKFAIIGPESSGKTTLCKQLSKHYNCEWIPEFARVYLEKHPTYSQNDLNFFLDQQILAEKQIVSSPIFCDTDPISFKVWSIYKYGSVSEHIISGIKKETYTHRLLLAPDLPYEFDPLRENSPLKNRIELFELFKQELDFHNLSYSIIEGLEKNRLNNVIKSLLTFI